MRGVGSTAPPPRSDFDEEKRTLDAVGTYVFPRPHPHPTTTTIDVYCQFIVARPPTAWNTAGRQG